LGHRVFLTLVANTALTPGSLYLLIERAILPEIDRCISLVEIDAGIEHASQPDIRLLL
jgi:hypothetical protein